MNYYVETSQDLAIASSGFYSPLPIDCKLPTNWKFSKGSMIYCYCCNNLIQSSHDTTCHNYGKENEDEKIKCNCNIRVKSAMIPICRLCHDINTELGKILFGNDQFNNGMLFRFIAKHHSYALYSLINENNKMKRCESNISMVTDDSSTDFCSEISRSTTFLQGFDVIKIEHCFCPLCGYVNTYSCTAMSVVDQRTTHEELLSRCSNGMCQQYSMIKIRFWSILTENKDTEINIIRTLTNLNEIVEENSLINNLNDFKKKRRRFEKNIYEYPDSWFQTNKDPKAIYMSCLELTKHLKLYNTTNINIQSSQEEIDVINTSLGLVKNINFISDKLKVNTSICDKFFTREPIQVSPIGVNEINDINDEKYQKINLKKRFFGNNKI